LAIYIRGKTFPISQLLNFLFCFCLPFGNPSRVPSEVHQLELPVHVAVDVKVCEANLLFNYLYFKKKPTSQLPGEPRIS